MPCSGIACNAVALRAGFWRATTASSSGHIASALSYKVDRGMQLIGRLGPLLQTHRDFHQHLGAFGGGRIPSSAAARAARTSSATRLAVTGSSHARVLRRILLCSHSSAAVLQMSTSYAKCKLSLQLEGASAIKRRAFPGPHGRQFQLDVVVDAVFPKKIRRMDHAIAGLVAQLEQIAAGGGMADRQDAEIPIAAQQNHRFKPGKIPVVDVAVT